VQHRIDPYSELYALLHDLAMAAPNLEPRTMAKQYELPQTEVERAYNTTAS
jgi:hypothetical protein